MKRHIMLIARCAAALALLFALASVSSADPLRPRFVDDAELLLPAERSSLLSKLDETSARIGADIVIVTTGSVSQRGVTADADDFFDENGYGQGDGADGILLYIAMADRDWAVSTSGRCISAFTDAGQQHIMSVVLPYLSDGDYNVAFEAFIDLCAEFIEQADNGDPYDEGDMPRGPYPLARNLGIAIGVGLVIAIVRVSSLKAQLKTIRSRREADDYVKQGSMTLTTQEDSFLYTTLSRVPRPKKSSSGGGSSTHTSSSGRTHGGSSGKF